MNKLIDKFDDIVDNCIDEYQNSETGEWYTVGESSIGITLANEAKKLALAFANYQENSQYDEDKYISQEALFDKFIEEFYE